MEYPDCTKAIRSLLQDKGVDFQQFEHEPVTTSEEAADVRENFSVDSGAKALIVKLYKKEDADRFFMLVVPGDKRFDKKKVLSITESDRMRFADEEEIDDVTDGVPIGGIPPFGSIFGLEMFVDESIFDKNEIVFNAGERTISIALSAEDYKRVIDAKIVDIT